MISYTTYTHTDLRGQMRWIPSRLLRELIESSHWVTSHRLSAVLVNWGAPVDQRLANVTPIYKMGRKGNQENYKPVTLTLVQEQSYGEVILDAIPWHMQHPQRIRASQRRGWKAGPAWLTKSPSTTGWQTECTRKRLGEYCLPGHLSSLQPYFHNIFPEKLPIHGQVPFPFGQKLNGWLGQERGEWR